MAVLEKNIEFFSDSSLFVLAIVITWRNVEPITVAERERKNRGPTIFFLGKEEWRQEKETGEIFLFTRSLIALRPRRRLSMSNITKTERRNKDIMAEEQYLIPDQYSLSWTTASEIQLVVTAPLILNLVPPTYPCPKELGDACDTSHRLVSEAILEVSGAKLDSFSWEETLPPVD